MKLENFQALLKAQEKLLTGRYSVPGAETLLLNDSWKQLISRYPRIDFGRCGYPPVDLGWWELLDGAFKKINEEMERLPESPEIFFRLVQIKEKFGCLRFYYDMKVGLGNSLAISDTYTNAIYAIGAAVDSAEALSEKTCEICGQPGVLRSGGWLKTLCDKHADS